MPYVLNIYICAISVLGIRWGTQLTDGFRIEPCMHVTSSSKSCRSIFVTTLLFVGVLESPPARVPVLWKYL